jgi:Ca2+-transporting ATPase
MLVPIIISITLLFIAVVVYVPFARDLFELEKMSVVQLGNAILYAVVGVFWIEIWKYFQRKR